MYNHLKWGGIKKSLLETWIYFTILTDDYEALRTCIQHFRRKKNHLHLGLVMGVNNFSWWGSHLGFLFSLSPLAFACLTGRYACVRVMLEEFEIDFKLNPLIVQFADSAISLPLATIAFDLFLPCDRFSNAESQLKVSYKNEVKYYGRRDLDRFFRTDYAGRLHILRLFPIHFPFMRFKKYALMHFPHLEHAHDVLSFENVVEMTNLPQGKEALRALTEAPTLLSLAVVEVSSKLTTEGRREEFKKIFKEELPFKLMDLIMNKKRVL